MSGRAASDERAARVRESVSLRVCEYLRWRPRAQPESAVREFLSSAE